MPRPKSKATGSEDFAALLTELRDSFIGEVDKIPAGRLTCEQWAEKWGKSASYTRRLLCHGVRKGIWESKKYRAEMPSRGIYPVPHYFRK